MSHTNTLCLAWGVCCIDTVQQAGSTSWLSSTAAMWLVQSPHESKTIGVAWSCALPLCLALLLEFVFSGIRCHCEGTGSRFHGQLLPEWPKTNCYLSNRWNQHSMKVRKTNFYPSNFSTSRLYWLFVMSRYNLYHHHFDLMCNEVVMSKNMIQSKEPLQLA